MSTKNIEETVKKYPSFHNFIRSMDKIFIPLPGQPRGKNKKITARSLSSKSDTN